MSGEDRNVFVTVYRVNWILCEVRGEDKEMLVCMRQDVFLV